MHMECPYELRPRWYWQRPSDRTRRILERLSRGRVLSGQPLLDLAYRIARKMTVSATNVVKAVCSWQDVVANGKWTRMSREHVRSGRRFIRLHIVKPTRLTCRWCGVPLYNENHSRCNARLCRELSAVAGRRHQTIRIRLSHHADPEMREMLKARFIATFYIRKLKEKKNAISLP